jgi:hypothetical protein
MIPFWKKGGFRTEKGEDPVLAHMLLYSETLQ